MIKTKSKSRNKFLEAFIGTYNKSSVQDTFPFYTINKDGIMLLENNFYSKMIRYEDINYRLAQEEDKDIILSKYFSILNMFDNTIDIQLFFINETDSKYYFEERVINKLKNDEQDIYRKELNEIMLNQLDKSVNGVLRKKYIIITIQEKNLNEAKRKLNSIESKLLYMLKSMGVNSYSVDGYERINLLKSILNKGEIKKDTKINFSDFRQSQISIKDYISPSSINFSWDNVFKIDRKFCQSLRVDIDASELEDSFLSKIIEYDQEMLVSISFQTVDQNKAIKQTKTLLSNLGKTKADEQRKNLSQGFDMDLLPIDLVSNLDETKELLDDLQMRNERFFQVSFTLLLMDKSFKNLENSYFKIQSICREHNCELRILYNQQEDGFISTLPLGYDTLKIKRGLTTSSLGILVPFTTQELFQESKNSLYYGYNAISSNILFFDRMNLKAPNGLYLGSTGSGKSFKVKREIVEIFLRTDDDIIVADPEREYNGLARKFKGQVVELSSNSTNYINPFDIDFKNQNSNTIKEKSLFIISLIEQIIGGIEGLSGKEISIIDRCVIQLYNEFLQNPSYETMPIFEDFYNILLAQSDEEAIDLATRIEIYVTGSMSVFNHRTNVSTNNRFTVFDINELKGVLKSLGLLILQDYVWNKVSNNRQNKKITWYFIDEIHLLLKDEKTAEYMIDFWKRFRKYGGVPTGITQNVTDLLRSIQISNIIKNSEFIVMLSQAQEDREILSKLLNISHEQLSFISNVEAGNGLIYYEGKIIPFNDHFSKNTELYKLMTTKLGE